MIEGWIDQSSDKIDQESIKVNEDQEKAGSQDSAFFFGIFCGFLIRNKVK